MTTELTGDRISLYHVSVIQTTNITGAAINLIGCYWKYYIQNATENM